MAVLKSYSGDELLYNKEETIIILKFIFEPIHHQLIDKLTVTDHVRSFAQALLVEAVDGSYAMGFIEVVVNTIRPTFRSTSITKILKKLGQGSAKHWYKNVSTSDLRELKVYESIRHAIGFKNASHLRIIHGVSRAEVHIIGHDKNFPFPGVEKVWC